MAKTPSSAKAEDAVRRYLTYLRNPSDLVDEKTVNRAQARVDRTAGDVIEYVLALAALERARTVDEGPIRDAFVAAVPGWAEEHRVSAEVLHSFGVPDDVLVDANLAAKPRQRRNTGRSRKTPAKKTVAPAPEPPSANGHGHTKIDYQAIADLLPPKGTTFLVTDVAAVTGKSAQQARNYLAVMRHQGLVEQVGAVDPWNGRGSAPYLFERA